MNFLKCSKAAVFGQSNGNRKIAGFFASRRNILLYIAAGAMMEMYVMGEVQIHKI